MPKLKIMSRSLLLGLYGSAALASLLPAAAQAQSAPAINAGDVVPSVSVVG